MNAWLLNLAIALDQLANVLLAGAPDETLSSRAHRMRAKGHRWWGWTAAAIDALFFFDPDHCARAHESEKRRQQQPADLRN
ncbi:hypothetical protein GmRootA79_46430 [Acidovorax sp. A79]|uniref:hypothetical protein n=1 Tax=Acidovorax sp. A79 TaxID=3056107 RepID=UPI0034E8EC52